MAIFVLHEHVGGKGSHHEAEMFFFNVFSQGQEQLDQKS